VALLMACSRQRLCHEFLPLWQVSVALGKWREYDSEHVQL
jgi:hypothetical protein